MTKEKFIEALKASELPLHDLAGVSVEVIKLMETKVNTMATDLQGLVMDKLKTKPDPAKP